MNVGQSNPIAAVSVQVLGGQLGSLVSGALQSFQGPQGLGQLQNLLTQLQSAMGQLSQLTGGAQGFGQQPGAVSPASIEVTIASNPLGFCQPSSTGLQTFTKPPLVGSDSQWPQFSDAVNARTTGSHKVYDGSNPWAKSGAARDEAGLVGWAMQQNDTVRYDSDRKMFYTTDQSGVNRDVMSLEQLKNVANGSGPISSNAGAPYLAVGNAINNAAAASTPRPLSDILQALQGVTQQLSSAGSSSAASSNAAGAGGTSATNFSSGNEGGWGKIDSMMSQAEQLMNSDKPSDQLKAQQLMQKAQRMFEMISKMMEQQSQMISKAIQAIK